MKAFRLLLDAVVKYMVLLAVVAYLIFYGWMLIKTGKEINLPDFLVMFFTLVVQYFFRRSPKEADDGNLRGRKE